MTSSVKITSGVGSRVVVTKKSKSTVHGPATVTDTVTRTEYTLTNGQVMDMHVWPSISITVEEFTAE